MNRREVLEAPIQCCCHDREDQHGNPEDTFSCIADLWEMYLCHKYGIDLCLQPEDVGVMMTLFKIARFAKGKHSDDNAIDGAAYFALANELKNRRTQSTRNESKHDWLGESISETEKAIRAFSR